MRTWLRLSYFASAAWLLLACPALRAGSLDNNVLALFPKNVGRMAFLDLSEARQLPWFAQFQQQVVPAGIIGFEQFISAAGVNPNAQIDEVAWAYGSAVQEEQGRTTTNLSGGGLVGVITGHFDPDSAIANLQSNKYRSIEANGYTFYSCVAGPQCGDFYFLFLDSETAAFGQLGMLEQLAAVKSGAAENVFSNQPVYALINQVNGDTTFWDVADSAGAQQTIRQLVPEASRFPQSAAILGSLKSLTTTVEISGDMTVHSQIVCASPADCSFLSQALQAALLLQKYNSGDTHSALAQMLDQISTSPSGSLLDISIDLTTDELTRMIAEDSFVQQL